MSKEHQSEYPVITLVEKQKRRSQRYNIYINDTYAFSIHEDVLIKYRIAKGQEIEPQEMERILHDDERQKAYTDAIRYLGRQPRSAHEIRERLKQKGYAAELSEEVLQTLKEQKYIDDSQFAKSWAENRLAFQKKGRRLIRQELQHKGIDKDSIVEAVNTIDEDEEYRIALDLCRKKWKNTNGETMDRMRKTSGFLLRRGYPPAVVQRVIREVMAESSEQWDEEPDFL